MTMRRLVEAFMTDNTGIPGLRGTDHIGFTVPDLEQAVDFFVNVIGCELATNHINEKIYRLL